VSGLIPYVADALVILGVAVMTLAVYGAIRMPDIYTRLHAASKAVFLGIISFVLASVVTGEPGIVLRVLLIGLLLLVTTPVAAHTIARAAYRGGEPMTTPGAIDESEHGLAEG